MFFALWCKNMYVRMCACNEPSNSALQESHQLHIQADNEQGPGHVQLMCLPAEIIYVQSMTAVSFRCWV